MFTTVPLARWLWLAFVLTLIPAAPTLATEILPTVVVSATRTARTADQNLAPVTVIEQEDIVRSNAVTIPEVLRNVPGIDFNSSGGFGKATNMSLRGTNANHVLLLIEGIPLGSATVGTPAWEYLPLTQIQRIEVVSGPRSNLYGSSAIGGIVQMFLPRGDGPAHVEFSTMGGSLDTHDSRVSLAGATGNTHYYLGGGHLYTAGINAGNPFSPNESDTDGYRNSSFGLRLGHRFGNVELDGHLLHAEGHGEFDGAPDEDFLQQIAGLNLVFSPLAFCKTRLTLGESRDERNSVPSMFSYRLHTRRAYTAWQNDLTLASNHLLTVGVERQDEHVDSNTAFTVNSRENIGVFLQHQANFERHDLIVGLRHDDNEAFGGYTTGNLAYGIRLTPGLRFTAAWSNAFKAPTFNDLYWPFDGFYVGNPSLHPETAHAYELSLVGTPTWGSWELRTFRTDIDDLITYTYNLATNTGTMVNLKRARIDGLEFRAATRFSHWELSSAFDFLDPQDRDTDKILPRRALHTARINIARQFGPLRSTLTVLNQGGRYDNADNTKHLSGYNLVDIGLNYTLNQAWILEGRVNNVFDEDYQTVAGYYSPNRTVMIGVRYMPR